MTATIEYDPTKYSTLANMLIMLRAEIWNCRPSEALARLLDEVATKELKPDTQPA